METLPEDIEFTTEEVEEYKAEFAKVRFFCLRQASQF